MLSALKAPASVFFAKLFLVPARVVWLVLAWRTALTLSVLESHITQNHPATPRS